MTAIRLKTVIPVHPKTEDRGTCRPNNSLERTQPQRGFMHDVAVLRRSARGR